MMRLIERTTEIPVPHVYAHASTTSGNLIGWPYILMSKAEGVQLEWDDIPREGRERVMMGLAKLMCQLSPLAFDQIGSIVSKGDNFVPTRSVHRSLSNIVMGPFRSAKDY